MSKYPPAIAKAKSTQKNGKNNASSFRLSGLFNRVSEKTIIDFTRSLAVMIKARIPLMQALDTAIEQSEDHTFRNILESIRKQVKSGASLAGSLSRHDSVFDGLYIHMVKVGELAGILDEVLFRLAGYMEKRYSLKKKVKMAMIYPGLVLGVATGAVLFLLLFIVPTFAEMYNDFDAELPQLTQIVLNISSALTDYFVFFAAGFAMLVIAVHMYSKTGGGRYFLDKMKLKIPFLGALYVKTLITRFFQTLGTLLKSGITLDEALGILKKASGNVLLEEATEKLLVSVKRGGSLKKSLQKSQIFPGMVVQMVTVGEETSELDEMLLHIAGHYDEEVETMVDGLTSIIEPVLIVLLGILLGGIIVAMYLPIFQLMNVIG